MSELDDLLEKAESLEIEVSEDDSLEVLRDKIASASGEEEAPKPKPVRKKSSRKKTAVKAPEPVAAPSDESSVEVPASLPGLPPTHQPSNLDKSVRYVISPDGVKRPMRLVDPGMDG